MAEDNHYDLPYQRDTLRLSDGGQIGIDWVYPESEPEQPVKVCIVFPGLSGASNRGYIKSLVRYLQ